MFIFLCQWKIWLNDEGKNGTCERKHGLKTKDTSRKTNQIVPTLFDSVSLLFDLSYDYGFNMQRVLG